MSKFSKFFEDFIVKREPEKSKSAIFKEKIEMPEPELDLPEETFLGQVKKSQKIQQKIEKNKQEKEKKRKQIILEEQAMYKFSQKSKEKLESCHPDLQRLMEAAIKVSDIDFGISCGRRNKKEQDEHYRTGKSKVQYPNSKHNSDPSMAVDIFAYVPTEGGVTWKLKYYYYLAGVISVEAKRLGIKIRWGGDFNQNGNYSDDSFLDGVHYELVE